MLRTEFLSPCVSIIEAKDDGSLWKKWSTSSFSLDFLLLCLPTLVKQGLGFSFTFFDDDGSLWKKLLTSSFSLDFLSLCLPTLVKQGLGFSFAFFDDMHHPFSLSFCFSFCFGITARNFGLLGGPFLSLIFLNAGVFSLLSFIAFLLLATAFSLSSTELAMYHDIKPTIPSCCAVTQ